MRGERFLRVYRHGPRPIGGQGGEVSLLFLQQRFFNRKAQADPMRSMISRAAGSHLGGVTIPSTLLPAHVGCLTVSPTPVARPILRPRRRSISDVC